MALTQRCVVTVQSEVRPGKEHVSYICSLNFNFLRHLFHVLSMFRPFSEAGIEECDYYLLNNSDIATLTPSLPLQLQIRRVRDNLVSAGPLDSQGLVT